jgi:choline kinase
MVEEETIAVVVAAGLGSRILPLSHEVPKCMLEVQNQSMLHRALMTFHNLNITKTIVVGGHKSDKLELPPGTELVLNDQYQHNNILHSLAYARSSIGDEDSVLVAYSDIVFRQDVVERLLAEEGQDISILVDQGWEDRYVGRTLHPLSEAEAAQFDSNGRLLRIGKNLLTPQHDSHQWGEFIGMLKLTRAGNWIFWDLFNELDAELDRDAPFQQSSNWRMAYITDLLQELVDRGEAVHCTLIRGGWLEIDTLQDYETAQSFNFAGGSG